MVNLVVLSIGSNEGDRGKNIKDAVKLLEKEFNVTLKKSPVYDTPPLFFEAQPNFLNCCVTFRSDLSPAKIFEITSSIEKKLGRTRGVKHGPRIIDIDIIFVGDTVIADTKLTVPHPGMQDRLFVLIPLADIYPDLVHPALQLTIEEMIEECPDKSQIREIADFWK